MAVCFVGGRQRGKEAVVSFDTRRDLLSSAPVNGPPHTSMSKVATITAEEQSNLLNAPNGGGDYTTDGSSKGMALTFDDPTLLRGASAHVLLKNRAEIFSSNVLSDKDVSQLHNTTAQVNTLDDFFSHSWSTGRFDKWAALLLYLNAPAAALAMAVSAAVVAILESLNVIPTLILTKQKFGPTTAGQVESDLSGMSMIVGLFFGGLFLLQWQRIRQVFGYESRMCFLDKICIDQKDEARKTAGIASLGAFLASSDNFVVLFSPEYFTRLWCCYELAAFYQVKGQEKQKIVFVPVAFPRVLFANLIAILLSCMPTAVYPLVAPWLGADPNDLTMAETNWLSVPGLLLGTWTMYECQRYAIAREKIEEQIRSFSLSKAQCFDESDRPRIEREVARWFGAGDKAEGIQTFDSYVRRDIKKSMEQLTGRNRAFAANIPWRYVFLSGAGATLTDVASLCRFQNWTDFGFQSAASNLLGCASCALVGTPMVPVVMQWFAAKRFRFGGGWPMIVLGPAIMFATWSVLIVGSFTSDFHLNVVQFCLSLLFGAFVFRESLFRALKLPQIA